jgi:DNA-binding MarR family transcriptional regulator
MASQLAKDIKQKKRFVSLEQEAFLLLQRTINELSSMGMDVLKAAGLSGPQYNVLRILRGAGPKGLACGEISELLITRDPDITRLLDRMEKRGLVARRRESGDRRVVTARITKEGLALLADLDRPVNAAHKRQLGHLSRADLRTLIAILERARKRPAVTEIP